MGRIADEVIAHLAGFVGSQVKVTLEVEAEVPSGVPDSVVQPLRDRHGRARLAGRSGVAAICADLEAGRLIVPVLGH